MDVCFHARQIANTQKSHHRFKDQLKKGEGSPKEESDGKALTLLVGAGARLHGEHATKLAFKQNIKIDPQWH